MRLTALLFLAAGISPAQSPVPQSAPPAGQPANCAADGYVVNAVTGEPVPRARVIVYGPVQISVLSDGSGRWRMSHIGCGRLSFSASRPGFLSAGLARVQSAESASPDSPLRELRLELVPQAVVSGKVTDDAGDPVPNASVTVYSSRVLEGRRSFQQGQMNTTNDLGEYRMAGLGAGKLILCARAPLDVQALEASDGMVSGETCYPGPVEGGAAGAMNLPAGREARVDFTLALVPAAHIREK